MQMTIDEFKSQFDRIYIETFKNLADMPVNLRPRHLAHYTSLSVLEKIVMNNEIWFSHPSSMNDNQEMRFGIREGIRVMQDTGADSSLVELAGGRGNFESILNHYIEFIRIFDLEVSTDVYVFCLSVFDLEKWPDGRLSMRRGYGANGNGVALVFNTSFLTAQVGSPLLIAKVQYVSDEERTGLIRASFTKCLNVLKQHGADAITMKETARNMFRMTLYHALSSKHPGFGEEEEWRIVYFSDLDVHDLLKDRRGYLVRGDTVEPKLKFPVEPLKLEPRQDWTFDSILERIVLGPTHSSAFAQSSARRMLQCLEPKFTSKLWVSGIPYRRTG